ncbi:InlB B-repeat-containing protein [Hymenobacter negativus]|uniref:Carbohydrate-binding protein n=1 Tax=Hymenobacter negativus TaxID=2795026 RepID=A0ABS3QAE7_9BACT|nr:carbohydrate-binding protein [Hymenobacter negativus]MBO2008207.1 carbohydrate-binding protein [Hymenobacter negativus]
MKQVLQHVSTRVLLSAALLAGYPAAAQTTLYVGPAGTDSNSGASTAAPTTLTRAITAIADGGTIYMLGGTYSYSTGVTIAYGNNGTTGKRIEAYQGQVPVLNFSGQATANANRGFTVNGNKWYIKGLIVERAGDNGIYVGGSFCTFELCTTRYNKDSGLQLGRYASTATRAQWPHDNLILNCTSYDNQDPGNENADGFACKLTTGANNKFKGCISHHNIDDGWDFYAKTDTGPIDPVTLEDCVAYSNGALSVGSTSGSGDKNGFKLGGSGIAVAHLVVRCVAFNNGHHGFTDNDNPGPITLINNTSYNNAVSNYSFREGGTHRFINNLSFQGGSSDKTIGTLVSNSNVFWVSGASSNGKGLVVSAADFVSTTAPATVGRTSGNAPDLGNFLALAAGSDLINAGVVPTIPTNSAPVSYTYSGSNPDVGARESGNTTTPTSYTLTTAASPAAGGTITRSPNATSYAAGTVVTLTAVPAAGYVFAGWSGAASGSSATTTVTVTANSTATATFTPSTATTYTLTTTASPTAGGTITRSPNASSYAAGTVVTLTATAAAGYAFSGWSGASTATTATTTVTVNANSTATAAFTATGGGATTLRIEDAATFGNGYCGADGSRQNSYTGADNGYYINLSNSAAKGINWSVSVPAAGTYTLRWRYANAGGSSATTAKVLVNGATAVSSVPFPKTSSWTTWTTTTASVALAAGANAIRLETTVAAEFANIDWIEVVGNGPTAGACGTARMAAPGATANNSEAPAQPVESLRLFPNPATSSTALRFELAAQSRVSIRVVDAMGVLVKTLPEQLYEAGAHTIALGNAGLKPGTYTLLLLSNEGKQNLRLEVR